jgi:DNA processing protein
MAERLACDLAARGLVIFSGLARGVDSAAHRGAVAGKGKTVAILNWRRSDLSQGELSAC